MSYAREHLRHGKNDCTVLPSAVRICQFLYDLSTHEETIRRIYSTKVKKIFCYSELIPIV
jgi:hypothetical protein